MQARRRWSRLTRFSVKTLLVVITVLAILIGLETNRVRRQNAAISVVQRLGGSISFDYERGEEHAKIRRDGDGTPYFWDMPYWTSPVNPPAPRSLRSLFGDDFFRRLERVYLGSTGVSDADIKALGYVLSLRSIELQNTRIGDEGLAHVRNLRNLRLLIVGGDEITDEGLRHLAQLTKLEALGLHCSRINGTGFRYLTGLKCLRILDIGAGRGAASGMRYNVPATKADDDAVQYLKQIKTLEMLIITETKISKNAEQQLRQALPRLSIHHW
jgi:hypothetical protein